MCFRCDERYYSSHKCRFKQFRVMIASEEEEEREETEAIEDGEVNLEEKEMELTLNTSSIVAIDSPKTMRLNKQENGNGFVRQRGHP